MSTIKEAERVFSLAFHDLGISSHEIVGGQERIAGIEAIREAIWLPTLMLGADRIGHVVMGKNVFPARYFAEPENPDTLRVEVDGEIDSLISGSKDERSLGYLIARFSCRDTLHVHNGSLTLRPFHGENDLVKGQEVYIPSTTRIETRLLSGYLSKAYPKIGRVFERASTAPQPGAPTI